MWCIYFYEHTQWQHSNSSDQRRNLHSQFNFTLGLMISKAHRFRICCRSIVACLCVLGSLLGKNVSSYCAQKHQQDKMRLLRQVAFPKLCLLEDCAVDENIMYLSRGTLGTAYGVCRVLVFVQINAWPFH